MGGHSSLGWNSTRSESQDVRSFRRQEFQNQVSTVLYPDLRPDVMNVHAVVTTKWGNSTYAPLTIPRLESYYVDTALDNDADTWSIEIGAPRGEYMRLFERNSEIRCQ